MPDTQLKEAAALIRQHFVKYMTDNDISSKGEMSRRIGISRSVIKSALDPNSTALPTPGTLKKIRKVIASFSKDEINQIETAYSRMISLTRSRGATGRHSRETHKQSDAENNDGMPAGGDEHERIMSVISRLEPILPQLEDMCGGNNTFKRYQAGEIPFVLTKKNFTKIDASHWGDGERQKFLDDTNKVLDEARRRMLLIAQLAPDKFRKETLSTIGQSAGLLWRTYKVGHSPVPAEYIRDINLATVAEKM
jgi:hypothetical protein